MGQLKKLKSPTKGLQQTTSDLLPRNLQVGQASPKGGMLTDVSELNRERKAVVLCTLHANKMNGDGSSPSHQQRTHRFSNNLAYKIMQGRRNLWFLLNSIQSTGNPRLMTELTIVIVSRDGCKAGHPDDRTQFYNLFGSSH